MFINHLSSDHLGGSELSLASVIDRWVERDSTFEPIIVTPSPGAAMESAMLRRGWQTIVLPYSGWAIFDQEGGSAQGRLRDRDNAVTTLSLIDLLRDLEPQLVVTNTVVAPWGALAASIVGIPHVWFVREFGDASQGFYFPDGRKQVLQDVGELSTIVFANSNAVRDELERFVPAGKLQVAYPWVELDNLRVLASMPPAEQPFAENAGLRVTVVGRVTASKGQWRVIEAIGVLAAKGVRVDVCFVGQAIDHGDDRILKRRAARLGVGDRIRFVGDQANPFAFMTAAEVCVTPSDREAFGRATLEALGVGRPVLATCTGGSAELVEDGVSGGLFGPEDVLGLARSLEKFSLDRKLAESMRQAARDRADSLMSSTLGVDDVIDLLTSASEAAPATLPDSRRAWFNSLDAAAKLGAPNLLKLAVLVIRWTRRFGRLIRDPRPAILRRLGRT